MFDTRDPKTQRAIIEGSKSLLNNIIDGCGILFGIMVIGLLIGLIYAIYVICTM